ncbi:hypothetical protein BRADI_1g66310v3 [Brachypodium distachyon]|uniref:Uncharacterized protein n=1 Tax=Brachypodium distachyon TaxID=15368 RepID=I1H6V2_BRADI|nr:hypothetical protein BRADI_1g66310v3 [Brachypodium distachyon]
MGSSEAEQSLVDRGHAAPLAADLEERSVLEEKLCCTRLELQKTLAVSADADETMWRLAAAARRVAQERDEARNHRNALLAQLQLQAARRNVNAGQKMMMAVSGGPGPSAHSRARPIATPNALFGPAAGYGRAPFDGLTTVIRAQQQQQQQQQYYARAGGGYYCFASSSSSSSYHGGFSGLGYRQGCSLRIGTPAAAAAAGSFHVDLGSSSQQLESFDPDMFLVDAAAESPRDVVVAPDVGSGAEDQELVGESSGGELGLVAAQMLRMRKGKAAAQAVRERDVESAAGPLARPDVADAGENEVGGESLAEECCGGAGAGAGAGGSLADVVSSAGKNRRHTS